MKKTKKHRCQGDYSLPEDIVKQIGSDTPLQQFNEHVSKVSSEWCSNDSWERNLLICTSLFGRLDIAQSILKKYKNGNSSADFDDMLSLPICIAAMKGHLELINTFLSFTTLDLKNVSLNITALETIHYCSEVDKQIVFIFSKRKVEHVSILDLALVTDNIDLLKLLLPHYAHTDKGLLYYNSCKWGAVECLEYLLLAFNDSEHFCRMKFIHKGILLTPLMLGVQCCLKFVKFVLSFENVSVNDVDNLGNNALHYAIGSVYLPCTVSITEDISYVYYLQKYKEYIYNLDAVLSSNSQSPENDGLLGSCENLLNTCTEPNFFQVTEDTFHIVQLLLQHGCDIDQQGTDMLFLRIMSNTKLQRIMKPFSCLIIQCFQSSPKAEYKLEINDLFYEDNNSHSKTSLRKALLHKLFNALKGIKVQSASPWALYEYPPWTVWNLTSYKKIKNIHLELDDHSMSDLSTRNLSQLAFILDMSVFSLSEILQLGFKGKGKCIFNHATKRMTISKIFSATVDKLKDLDIRLEDGIYGRESHYNKGILSLLNDYFTSVISLHLKYGIDLESDVLKVLKQSYDCSVIVIISLLFNVIFRILSSLSHEVFYSRTKAIHQYIEFRGESALKSKFGALKLHCNVRPLAHIARIAIYEGMGRCYVLDMNHLTSSRFIKEYLQSFVH